MKITIKIFILMFIFSAINSKDCDENCLECKNQSCLQCKSKFILYNDNCFSECPISTYKDEKWETCRKCNSACPICWGSDYDNCGFTKGISSKIVFIENEIINEISKVNFTENDISQWIIKLKLIMKKREKYVLGNLESDNIKFNIFENGNSIINTPKVDNQKTNLRLINKMRKSFNNGLIQQPNLNSENDKLINSFRLKENKAEVLLTQNEIYSSKSFNIDLPFGSFSKFDGVFIPIPSYIYKNIIVETHWIFVKGQYSNNNWNISWNPVIPDFLKKSGNKDKIYYENQGFWVYTKESWIWIKDKKPLLNNEYNKEDVELLLSNLNSSNYTNINSIIRNKLEKENTIKQNILKQNLNVLINNIKYSSSKTLDNIKEKINREKANFNKVISDLKNQINEYLKEEETLMNSYK